MTFTKYYKICKRYNPELKPGAQPYHARAYPVPQVYEKTTRKEIDRLTDIGVLVKDHNSPWAAATFIQPKKQWRSEF
jgi:hypothetical protein